MSSASNANNITDTSDPPAPQSTTLPPTHPFNPTLHITPVPAPAPSAPTVKPARTPLLRLELRDVSSAGAHAFLRLIHASDALSHAVDTVLTHLYRGMPQSDIPGTRSVTLVLRDMDGVAYTTGLELDDEHKEIHFNTSYISSVAPARQKEEIMGVLVHEMVHCWQRDGLGTAPTGLTEGVADWVRLKAGYAPPHWKRRTDCEWDAGYERTGYFLEWLEKEHGEDVVRRINGALRACKYEEERVWKECCGKGVKELWEEYKKCFEEESK